MKTTTVRRLRWLHRSLGLLLFVQLLRGRVGQQRVERGEVAVPRGLE